MVTLEPVLASVVSSSVAFFSSPSDASSSEGEKRCGVREN